MFASLDSIPWQGSQDQITVLTAMAVIVGYGLYVIIAKKDTFNTPRKSLWK